MLKPRLLGGAALALCLTAIPALAEQPILVTSDADRGEGTLRAALASAADAAGPATIVVMLPDAQIEITETLSYASSDPLTLIGNGATITTDANITLLEALGTRSLEIRGMAFEGPGGFSIEARGDEDGAAGKGIFLDVAETAEGTVALMLDDVAVSGVANHGIHISDCTLADECGGGGGGAGEGSAASIEVALVDVTIADVGNGRFDADGLRVDERGMGDILFTGMFLEVSNVGADGIELDEGQDGDVIVDVIYSDFVDNGAYCDPNLLRAFLPEIDEGAFDEGVTQADAIPGPVTGSSDDACFEREVDLYDDGSVAAYGFGIDVDDGFDIDEAGPGALVGLFSGGTMRGNLDEGFDFDEEGAGDIDVTFMGYIGEQNADDAIKLSEEGAGHVYAVVQAVEAIGNGGVGIVAEEEGIGDLSLMVLSSATSGNNGGELGIEAVQDDDGIGRVWVIDSEIADGIDTDGAEIDAD
ncbi:hypothetical protein V8J82_10525 [Gymnodinialimonas sp. 2305UL16-5]|uniref:hypothetical protein n=1 Tax=Gymnodinialimonas mytili TaxID=3126503 RepID=UPI00309657B1